MVVIFKWYGFYRLDNGYGEQSFSKGGIIRRSLSISLIKQVERLFKGKIRVEVEEKIDCQ